jgi:sugar phosphate isomerase/epimerase
MSDLSRRQFLRSALASGTALLAAEALERRRAWAADPPQAQIQLGLVTYMWGADLDLPALLETCEKGKLAGVELRTGHKHGVELSLNPAQRAEVRKRFAACPVKMVGIGSAEEFHTPDPKKLAKAIDNAKAFVKLSHDVGGSGVKVRPNDLPKGVPAEKTIEQIGKSLNAVAEFAAGYGQQIRLEVHGGCARLPVIKQIMDVATHPGVGVCWNSNASDLEPPGLEHNFNLVKNRLGATTHVKALDAYPFDELMKLFVRAGYRGWWLIEAGGKPPADRVQAFARLREQFDTLLSAAQAGNPG